MAPFSSERATQSKTAAVGATLTALTAAFSLSMGLLWATPERLSAQIVDLTIHDVGVAIGDKSVMTGVRLNFRDRNLVRVTGVNTTIWNPYEPAHGVVNGLALGVPMAGAATINGAAIGLFGVGAQQSITGIGIGGIGVGGGGTMRGILIGGIGVGAGRSMTGVNIGGIGVGSGGSLRGLNLGGVGVGSGGSVTGISVGGIGVGAGGSLTGLSIAGVGVGGGGGTKGIAIAGIGVGGGGDVVGLSVSGIGVGAGGMLRGVAIGGIGVGAPMIRGLAIGGLGVGGVDVHAIAISGAYFRIGDNGRFDGGAFAPVTDVRGQQHGITIGLFNYARELHGAQIGVINVSDNGGARRILPLVAIR